MEITSEFGADSALLGPLASAPATVGALTEAGLVLIDVAGRSGLWGEAGGLTSASTAGHVVFRRQSQDAGRQGAAA